MLISLVVMLVVGQAVPSKHVVIDLTDQKLYAYENLQKVMEFHISTGRKGMETPLGEFFIQQKQVQGRALKKYGGAKLPYAQRLRGHILIHGYKSVPRYPDSHGCIRMRPADAKTLFNWTRIGTPVTLTKGAGDCLL